MGARVVGPWPASGALREDRVLDLATCQYGHRRFGRHPLRRLAKDLGPSPSVEQLAAHFGVKPHYLTRTREEERREYVEWLARMRGEDIDPTG
jgi:hypothetical protein